MNIISKISEWLEDRRTAALLDTKEKRRILLEKRERVRAYLKDTSFFLNREARERVEKVLHDINEKLEKLKE